MARLPNLERVNNLVGVSGGERILKQQKDDGVGAVRAAVSELARRVQIELDRIYEDLRRVDANADESLNAGLNTLHEQIEGEILWERDSQGRIIPKPYNP